MPNIVSTAFELRVVQLPIARILPMKCVITDPKKNATFRRVLASIREVGLIEPLIVFPQGTGKAMNYVLLDGHTRFEALKMLGRELISCLISTEDEAYTYNHKVNVVPPIHEHFMIMRAIDNGVSEERIAAALDVDVASIRQRRDLLKGICPEAVELLKDKPTSREGLREFRKVRPMRQIEMAELMVRANNYSAPYAKCLIAATQLEFLIEPHKPKALKSVSGDELAAMEKEMASLEQNFLAIEGTRGRDVLNLVLATAYLCKLLDNTTVARFLTKHYPDIFAEFQRLIESSSLTRDT